MLGNRVLDAIQDIGAAEGVQTLQTAMDRFLGTYDIHSYTAAIIGKEDGHSDRLKVDWMATINEDWFGYYMTNDGAQRDYGLRQHAIERNLRPLKVGAGYEDENEDMRPDERELYRQCTDVDMVTGLTLPRWLPADGKEVASGFSFWTALDKPSFEQMLSEHAPGIVAFLLSVEGRLLPKMIGEARGWTDLTCRERECLEWIAAGYRPAEIADKLNLATVTVNLHLRTARKRLDARTLPEAVAKALSVGLLKP